MDARTLAPLATRCDAQLLVDEVATLSPYRLLEAGEFELYLAPASQMPRLLEEIGRSEEHTSELQSLMRISYAVFCLKKKKKKKKTKPYIQHNTNHTNKHTKYT